MKSPMFVYSINALNHVIIREDELAEAEFAARSFAEANGLEYLPDNLKEITGDAFLLTVDVTPGQIDVKVNLQNFVKQDIELGVTQSA